MAKKILVVDDEPELVEAIQIRLKNAGYEVITAYNGEEGLKKVKAEKPDLILLDILMPEMDGITMAATLRDDPDIEGIPIIFLTCVVKKGEEKEAEQVMSGKFFIAKPFNTEELLAKVKEALSANDRELN